jgi:uracil-DNA glycosylase
MSDRSHTSMRGALRRYLETDLLLGVYAVPLRAPARGTAQRGRIQGGRPGSLPPTAAGQKLQPISCEELARRTEALRLLDEREVSVCEKCPLHETRTKTVLGQGNAAARLVFVGEAPGRDEDLQGLAFVGRAGQLLTRMIEAMGLTRDEVFICNILKCRPPNNRDPAPAEVAKCWPYLDQQLRIIRPDVIVALGKPATQALLHTTEGIGQLRGQWHEYVISDEAEAQASIPLMPTYHPAYLLRSPAEKNKAWSDLKQVLVRLGLTLPK